MPSGKQSKRQRRAAVPPPPTSRRKASPRVLAIAGGALVLVAVAIVLAVALSGGSSKSSTTGSLSGSLPGAGDVQRLLQGIPQHGSVLGSPAAPVTLVEYIDLQCPYCREFETQAMPTLIAQFVRTGKVKVQARPLAFIGPDSVRGRNAVLAAAGQGKLFNVAQLLYDNQGTENTGWLDDAMVRSAAASIPGLDVSRLLRDAGSSAVSAEGSTIDAQATADGVRSTPTVLVGRSGTKPSPVTLASPTDERAVAVAIQRALGR